MTAITQNKSGHNLTKGTHQQQGGRRKQMETDKQAMQVRMTGRENTKCGQYGYKSKIVFDQFVILSKSEEREEAAACLSEG